MFYIIPTLVKKTVKEVIIPATPTDNEGNPLYDSGNIIIIRSEWSVDVEYYCWWWFWWRLTKCKKSLIIKNKTL